MLEERARKQWDPLVKQTYSVWVDSPRGRRKWHLSKRSQPPPKLHPLFKLTWPAPPSPPQLHISHRQR